MPNSALTSKRIKHAKRSYRQQYYHKHQDRYAASYQKKREGTYLCDYL